MLQLVYASSARHPMTHDDVAAVLATSQANNSRDEITGLLYTDGKRFLQAIEGPKAVVEDAFLRIVVDIRHHGLVLLSRRETTKREFGEWAMARRSFDETHNTFLARIAELCRNADPSVQGTFAGLIEARRAA